MKLSKSTKEINLFVMRRAVKLCITPFDTNFTKIETEMKGGEKDG